MKTYFAFFTSVLLSVNAFCFDYQAFSENASLKFGVETNFEPKGHFISYVELTNRSEETLTKNDRDWAIYIHFVRRILEDNSDEVDIEHIQGDLYRITPTRRFVGVKPGERLRVAFKAVGHIASYSYFMPNAFIVNGNGDAFVFANTATQDVADYTFPLAEPQQYLRFNSPTEDYYGVTTPLSRYEQVSRTQQAEHEPGIIPTPKEVHTSKGVATIDSSWSVQQTGGLGFEVGYLEAAFEERGVSVRADSERGVDNRVIRLEIDSDVKGNESYELNIKNQQIHIVASSKVGVFYGVQSLISLLPLEATDARLPVSAVRVFDSPRFAWRGMHYDVARNFHGKAAILDLLEQMGRYKMNKLHLHLTDDEGWRLEIPGLEELTRVGATRCFDLDEDECLLTQLGSGPNKESAGTGYLSKQDYIDILTFAKQRHIEVIPEIDMPGHARAAVVSMKARYRSFMEQGREEKATQYLLSDPEDESEYLTVQSYSDNSVNVCMPSTYNFVDKVLYELQRMHRAAGAKLDIFHMGGDEVGKGSWTRSPICDSLFDKVGSGVAGVDDLKPYFVAKVARLAADRGMAIAGWEDGLMYDKNNPFRRDSIPNDRVIANAWDNIWEYGVSDRAHLLANAGYDVILSSGTHLYFDHPYEPNPNELGYHWATRATDLRKVFAFSPDNLYSNANRTLTGASIDNLDQLVDKVHAGLRREEGIIGMQGQLWTETIRTAEQLEQMVFPRLIALAERAWHKAEWEKKSEGSLEKDWQGFLSSVVQKELPRLERAGITFYLPPPGLKREDGRVAFNNRYPGLVHEYSQDGGVTWVVAEGNSVAYHKGAIYRARIGEVTSRSVRLDP